MDEGALVMVVALVLRKLVTVTNSLFIFLLGGFGGTLEHLRNSLYRSDRTSIHASLLAARIRGLYLDWEFPASATSLRLDSLKMEAL
jgi:hypothetical protein